MFKNLSKNQAGVMAGAMYLFRIATHNDLSSELFREITIAEREQIYLYTDDKCLNRAPIRELESMFSDEKIRKVLEDLCIVDTYMKMYGDHIAENQLPFERLKYHAEAAYQNNKRLDPEELRLLEGKLFLEGYMTPKKYEKFLELIKPYNQGRKVFLAIHGLTKGIDGRLPLDFYVNEFNKAGFDVAAIDTNLKDNKGHRIVDKNHLGRPNGVIFSPYSSPEEERGLIVFGFEKAEKQGISIPRIAIDTEKGDTPNKFNVHTILPVGASIPAILEETSELYRRFYLGQHMDGR